MALWSGKEYVRRIQKSKRRVYVAGRQVKNLEKHPVTRSVLDAIARMYDAALEDEYDRILNTTSPLTGEKTSRALHVPGDIEDLEHTALMARLTAELTGVCSYRAGGGDAVAALWATTWEMDRALDTAYHARFVEYLKRVQSEDLFVGGASADPKGNLNKRPAEESDPDLHLRVIEKRSDGIVLQGAKAHLSGAFAADEILVLPGMDLKSGEEAYAVACAVECGRPGLSFICQYDPLSAARVEADSGSHPELPLYGLRQTCLVVFDRVFVPWERVFMFGETSHAAQLAGRFFRIHRITAGAMSMVGYSSLVMGAAHFLAESDGTLERPSSAENLSEMARLRTTSEACAMAAVARGAEDPRGSGVYFPKESYSSVANLSATEGFSRLLRLAMEMAGGPVVTMPSERDLANSDTRAHLEKYLAGAGTVPVSERMRMIRFLQTWTSGLRDAEIRHGAGSVGAQRSSLFQSTNWQEMRTLARRLAGL